MCIRDRRQGGASPWCSDMADPAMLIQRVKQLLTGRMCWRPAAKAMESCTGRQTSESDCECQATWAGCDAHREEGRAKIGRTASAAAAEQVRLS
eukprot:9036737-Pyramimonas_sp.AAC.1